jgi:hypothetical protein
MRWKGNKRANDVLGEFSRRLTRGESCDERESEAIA